MARAVEADKNALRAQNMRLRSELDTRPLCARFERQLAEWEEEKSALTARLDGLKTQSEATRAELKHVEAQLARA